MKKINLIKSICFTAGLLTPAVALSTIGCGCSGNTPQPELTGPIPVEDLLIENRALLGLKPGVDASKYDTLCVPADVVEVSKNAFDAKFGGTVLPESIKNIEFADSEENSDQILYIAQNAFSYCQHVENIKFSKRIAFVDEKAFSFCTSLKQLDFSDWREKLLQSSPFVEETVFQGCSDSGELILPNTPNADADAYDMLSGTGLGPNWFKFQPQIQEDIDNNIKYYVEPNGDKVFAGLIDPVGTGSTFVIPKEYTKIGPKACYATFSSSYYGNIQNIVIESDSQLRKICYDAFGCNHKITTIDLSNCNQLETIDVAAFQGYSTSKLKTVNLPTSYESRLTNLGAYAFYGNGLLENADIQQTKITRIGTGSFQNCPNLETLDVPETTEWIGALVISGNKKISSITIDSNVKYIGARAFKDCASVKTIDFIPPSSNLQYIGQEAFYNCSLVTSVNLPRSVNYIGDGAFNISALETIDFGDGNPNYTVDDTKTLLMDKEKKNLLAATKKANLGTCFENWTELESIHMYALANITCDLKTLDLSKTHLSYIGGWAFYRLTTSNSDGFEIKLPDDPTIEMKYVGDRAFQYSDVYTINVDNWSNAKYGTYLFDHCNKLTEIEIPNGTTKIPSFAFQYCTNIKKITIPNTVQSIGAQAFFYCRNVNELKLDSFNEIPNWTEKSAFSDFGTNTGNTITCSVNSLLIRQWEQFFRDKLQVDNIDQWEFVTTN